MIVRVRNEAFRLLPEVLDLPGGQDSLELVDVDHATPVVDLAPVIQAGVGFRVIYRKLTAAANATAVTDDMDFWDASSWDSVFSPQSGDAVPPADWPLLLSHIGGIYAGAAGGLDDFQVRLTRSGVTPVEIPVFYSDTDGPGGSVLGPAAGGSPYIRQPPIYIERRTFDEVELRVEQSSGGLVTFRSYFEVFAAPEGVIPNTF